MHFLDTMQMITTRAYFQQFKKESPIRGLLLLLVWKWSNKLIGVQFTPGVTFQQNSRALLTPAGISSTLCLKKNQQDKEALIFFLQSFALVVLLVLYLNDNRRGLYHVVRREVWASHWVKIKIPNTKKVPQSSCCLSALHQLLCDLRQGH